MSALREVFARFGVEFDSKQLREGVAQVDKATGSLEELGHEAEDASESFGGFEGAAGKVAGLTAALAAAAAAAGVVVHQVLGFAEANRELELNATRLGVTNDEMQKLSFYARMAGQDTEKVTDAMSTLQERMRDAVEDPKSDPANQFKLLGIEIPKTFAEMDAALPLFLKVSDSFEKMGNQTDRVGASMTLFGDVGRELLPVLQKGRKGFEEAAAAVDEHGSVTQDTIDSSREMDRALAILELSYRSLKNTLLKNLIPGLTSTIDAISDSIDWFNKNQEAVARFGKAVAVVAGIVGTVLLPMLLKRYLPTMLATAASTIAATWPFIAAAAAIAAMVLVVDDLLTLLDGGDSVIGNFAAQLLGVPLDEIRAKFAALIDSVIHGVNQVAGFFGSKGIEFSATKMLREQDAERVTRENGGAAVGSAVRGGTGTVNQQNQININGATDPAAVAKEVSKHINRMNRSAVEANGV